MFVYEKKLQYPVKIANPNPKLAAAIISQYGGPDGELGASLRYLSQRYSMPYPELKGLLTDIGTEELGHLEMVGTIVHQLTRNLTVDQIKEAGFDTYFVDHTTGVFPQFASGYPWSAATMQVTGDTIADLTEDLAADENARRPDAGAEVAHGDAEIADRDEQTAGTGWEPERAVFLQMDSVAAGFQSAHSDQVDHAGDAARFGGAGRMVQRGEDPQPVSMTPLLRTGAAGLATLGLLLDEESGDAEEQRRRIEARIAAENFGAVVGLAAGVVIVAKEKHDEHAAQKEQEEQSHGQTMGGIVRVGRK